MTELHISIIAKEIAVKPLQVKAVAALLDEGATVPFIARYRKEATGSLDEVAITAIRDRLEPLAAQIFEQGELDIEAEAAAFINAEKGVASVEEALAGARDIIAEWVSEDQQARARMRELFVAKGIMRSRVF